MRTQGASALRGQAAPQPSSSPHSRLPGGHHTKTLARASAPALAMRALLGWQATAWMASSCFLRWAVISCTHVLLSRLHRRREQSWPVREQSGLWHPAPPLSPDPAPQPASPRPRGPLPPPLPRHLLTPARHASIWAPAEMVTGERLCPGSRGPAHQTGQTPGLVVLTPRCGRQGTRKQ